MSWLDDLVDFAHEGLPDSARESLWERGVSNQQISLFKIGHLGGKLPSLKDTGGFLEWSNGGRKLDDIFVFPLTSPTGKISGVQFRAVDRDRKGYMDYIVDKTQPVLFGLSQSMPTCWDTETIWLVEGSFDLFPLQRVFPNTVATLTARVSDNFLRLLKRMVKHVYLVYDRDATGQRGAERFQRTYGRDFRVDKVQLPNVLNPKNLPVKDNGELWEVWGDERFSSYFRCIEQETRMEI